MQYSSFNLSILSGCVFCYRLSKYYSSQILLFSCTLLGHFVQTTEYRYVENIRNTWHKPVKVHQKIRFRENGRQRLSNCDIIRMIFALCTWEI